MFLDVPVGASETLATATVSVLMAGSVSALLVVRPPPLTTVWVPLSMTWNGMVALPLKSALGAKASVFPASVIGWLKLVYATPLSRSVPPVGAENFTDVKLSPGAGGSFGSLKPNMLGLILNCVSSLPAWVEEVPIGASWTGRTLKVIWLGPWSVSWPLLARPPSSCT